jgi:hypothetical protein
LKPAQGKKFTTPYLEKPNTKRAGGVAQVVEHPPRKHEALSSNTLQKKDPSLVPWYGLHREELML